MINSRLYPIRPLAVASLLVFILSDTVLNNSNDAAEMFGEASADGMFLAQKYIGITLNFLLSSPELICRLDKGTFSLLYMADHVNKTLKADDLYKLIPGPNGGTKEIPALHLLEILSFVAATCPESSIRFYIYKLIEKIVKSADDEACLYILYELLDRCPYSSMNTAAVGLLKDQISRSIDAAKYQQAASVFATPLIKSKFFPIIFRFKSSWKVKPDSFWNDYNYVMQALNLYYLMLSKDYPTNFNDISQVMQIDTMKHVVDKINVYIESKK
ncbi:hypothetical protein BDF20DRAFT_907057 [Mycotypha africana]|uniref:uncharacterized protein n=1 Tax=Mycotypha africana TaxID=64632 RepID=UPI0023009A01|nr:uncharacterized protein BDF20DRAFT_907057 [Mycotypha africana]KAI8973475.1 hypothetical protein BDF20DRAFT_907057 [Mycotypha africana]